MTSTRISPIRFGFAAAGFALLTTLAVSAPAFAVNEFPPNAVVTASSGCEGETFYLHTTMSNPGGLSSAHFILTAAGGTASYNGIGIDIAPNDSRVDNWIFLEGQTGFVHITSSDHNPFVDYSFEVTPDCVAEVTTTVATTIPPTTVPATTIPATTIPAPTTTVAAQLVPTALPVTGSSDSATGVMAFGLLGIGILMLRFTRRAS